MTVFAHNALSLFLDGKTTHYCRGCKAKTPHSYAEAKKVIRVVNRSRKTDIAGRKFRCRLRPNEYYLQRYSVYRCDACGREMKMPGFSRRISEKHAKASDLELVHNLNFWLTMHR